MPGHLFTEYFLTEGIRSTSEWRQSVASADAFESFRDGVGERYESLSGSADPNEAVTEQELGSRGLVLSVNGTHKTSTNGSSPTSTAWKCKHSQFAGAQQVAEHGCKWRGLPPRFGRWHTITHA